MPPEGLPVRKRVVMAWGGYPGQEPDEGEGEEDGDGEGEGREGDTGWAGAAGAGAAGDVKKVERHSVSQHDRRVVREEANWHSQRDDADEFDDNDDDVTTNTQGGQVGRHHGVCFYLRVVSYRRRFGRTIYGL